MIFNYLIFDPINRFVWSLAIFTLFLSSIFYLIRFFKKTETNKRLLLLGFSCLFFGLSFSRLFYFISDYYSHGLYDGHSFFGWLWASSPLFDLFGQLATYSFLVGMCVFIFLFEYIIRKTNYLLTLTEIIFIILLVVFPSQERNLTYISTIFNGIVLLVIMLWFTKTSDQEFQIVSILMIIGLILYITGSVMDSALFKYEQLFSPTLPAFFIIFGALVSISPVFFKPKKLSKPILRLLIGLVSCVLALIVGISISLLSLMGSNSAYYLLISIISLTIIITTIISLYIIYSLVMILYPSQLIKVEKELDSKKDLLSIFTRPYDLSEKDIYHSKENRICLVCKKKLGRYIYLCPECNALYCKECSLALVDIENACWVCNTPIDPSKPVKLIEIKEESNQADKLKKLGLITVTDLSFFEKIEQFKWEGKEKEEFLKYMFSLSPGRRSEVLDEMILFSSSMDQVEDLE